MGAEQRRELTFFFPRHAKKSNTKNKKKTGKPASWASNIEVGLSTNLNKLCGCVLQDMVDPSRYVDEFPNAFEKVRGNFDLPAISALYDAADFIGISNYASFPNADFKVKDLESATWQFAFEAGFFGVDVKDLIFNKGEREQGGRKTARKRARERLFPLLSSLFLGF